MFWDTETFSKIRRGGLTNDLNLIFLLIKGLQYVRPGNDYRPHKNMHIYGKLNVNGDEQHPLYEFLKESCPQTIVELGNSKYLHYNPIR